ncbi:hypothetical protein [Paraburkholderia dipogonis]|uniref:hypothetical protein n=1 Tax=Paraburkholderia dipogonis TaxID=1211383 RepID=UPI0038BA1F04
MSFEALYPSAAGGTGAVLSPLAESAPAAAPVAVAAPAAPAVAAAAPAASEPAADAFDAGDYVREYGVGRLMREGPDGTVEYADDPADETSAPQEAAAYVETRDKIANALADVRSVEPPADSVTAYAAVTSYPKSGVEPDTAERDLALSAFQKAGLGTTAVSAVWQAGMDALKSPVTTNTAGAMDALTAAYGEHAEARLADAKAYISTIEQKWPNVKAFLNKTGLGNDPAFIKFVIDKARKGA